eukprot:6214622-Pleurochrysis_carterae.AAC.1
MGLRRCEKKRQREERVEGKRESTQSWKRQTSAGREGAVCTRVRREVLALARERARERVSTLASGLVSRLVRS